MYSIHHGQETIEEEIITLTVEEVEEIEEIIYEDEDDTEDDESFCEEAVTTTEEKSEARIRVSGNREQRPKYNRKKGTLGQNLGDGNINLEVKTSGNRNYYSRNSREQETFELSYPNPKSISKKCSPEKTSSHRYISIKRHPRTNCKFVSVGFMDVQQRDNIVVMLKEGEAEKKLMDCREEEIIEIVYTHHIHEVVIYEDEA